MIRFAVLVTLLSGALLMHSLWSWAQTPLPRREPQPFTVEVGELPFDLAERLANAGWTDSAWRFSLYAKLRSPGWQPAVGEHWLSGSATPNALVGLLGRTGRRTRRRVVIPEGYNRFQVAERLEELGVCSGSSFLMAGTNKRRLRALKIAAPTVEGYLFPATYQVYVNTPAPNVMGQLVEETYRRFPAGAKALREGGALAKMGWGIYEVLTLASMVEKEAGAAEERATIAGVFLNRLRSSTFRPRRMLQSDPTAGYGCRLLPDLASCTGFTGRIVPAMLRDAANPYNTYRHAGLPPGPIANPGTSAVRAVLEPESSDYLFFVAGEGGRHVFSRTLTAHRKATHKR